MEKLKLFWERISSIRAKRFTFGHYHIELSVYLKEFGVAFITRIPSFYLIQIGPFMAEVTRVVRFHHDQAQVNEDDLGIEEDVERVEDD